MPNKKLKTKSINLKFLKKDIYVEKKTIVNKVNSNSRNFLKGATGVNMYFIFKLILLNLSELQIKEKKYPLRIVITMRINQGVYIWKTYIVWA